MTYLPSFRQILGCIGAERLDAHKIPNVTPFPSVCDAPRCECDVPFLGDILREYAGTREDGLRATYYLEDANTLPPEAGVRARSLRSLHERSAACPGYHQAPHPIENIDES